MTSTALHANSSEQIRRVLELTDSADLLPHFSRDPGAIEVAMRSALESLIAHRFHRSPYLERLEEADEIGTALQWQIEAIETFRSTAPANPHRVFFRAVTNTLPSPRLSRWLQVIQSLETQDSGLTKELEVALTAALRTQARSADYLGPYVRRLPPGEMLDVTQAAKLLDVTRPTVYEWLKKGRLIGWERGSKQGLIIPAEQIVGPGQIAEGIEEVIAEIEDAELAWDFLSNPWPFSGGAARPIEKLLKGGRSAKEVVDAAPAYLSSMG